MDIYGPMQIVSLGGSLYFMLLVDDFSQLCLVFFLHQKSEAFPRFSSWLVLTQKELGHLLKTLCADKGEEFTSIAMVKLCCNRICKHRYSIKEWGCRMQESDGG